MADTRPTWSYEPGAHLAVLGPDLAAVLPGAHPSQVARLWAAVDDGADLVGVLDRLLVDGWSRCRSSPQSPGTALRR